MNGLSSKTNKKVIQSYSAEVKIESMPKSRLPELIDKAKSAGLSYRDIQRRAGGEDDPEGECPDCGEYHEAVSH